MSKLKIVTGNVQKEKTKEQDDDHALGLKFYDLYWMLVEANKDIKRNKWKRELLDSI